jgi:hypothetical protein
MIPDLLRFEYPIRLLGSLPVAAKGPLFSYEDGCRAASGGTCIACISGLVSFKKNEMLYLNLLYLDNSIVFACSKFNRS